MFLRALPGMERVLGLEHQSTLTTVYNLGCVYKKKDKLLEAETMFQRALDGYSNLLGHEHVTTLRTVDKLGRHYRKQGRVVEAEALEQRAVPSPCATSA